VTDTGIGIHPNDIPNLFTLFGKLKGCKEINANGVGLGLSICKLISKAFDGDIEV
jgi:signal transduction histidine kinase